jgi:hypothetical protein
MFKEISLLVNLAKGERGRRKKSICSRSIEKCALIKEHRKQKRKRKLDPLQK